MKNNWTLLPITLISAFLSFLIVSKSAPQDLPATEPVASDGIDLRYALLEAPPEIEATAEALGLERIAYVRPSLYTKSDPRRWDQEKAERNFAAIAAICDGAAWIITDLEWLPRRIIRWPENYTPAQLRWAVNENFLPMWAWFRSHWPAAKLSEWNLNNAFDSDQYPIAERLVINYLDAFDVGMFALYHADWKDRNKRILAHAIELSKKHGKPVITSVAERYTVRHDDGISESAPLPHDVMHEMVEIAVSPGVDVAWAWSRTYAIYFWDKPNPRDVLTEVMRGDEHPLESINAQSVLLPAQMRLRVQALGGDE